jgi:hypothetical protein
MERDFFKQYIQEHKDAFENEALPPNMLGNILDKLKEREKQAEREVVTVKKLRVNYAWLAIACTLLVVGGAYLWLLPETADLKKQENFSASNSKHEIEIPGAGESIEPKIIQSERKLSAHQKLPTKKQTKLEDPYQAIYDGLKDSTSVATRLDAIIQAGAMTALNQPLKAKLCRTFNEDSNDNVRLAALEVLSKIAKDEYVHEQLMAGLSKQKDPVVQLELIKIMGNNSSPEATDKLIAMANNPLTLDAVKEQVYYALLTNQ